MISADRELINRRVEASVSSVRIYVQQYMSQKQKQALASITAYADRYNDAMHAAIAASEKGGTVRCTSSRCMLHTYNHSRKSHT